MSERQRTPPPDRDTAHYSVVVRRSAAALPTVAGYLAQLPDGLHSYPAARVKGLTLRTLVLDPVHPLEVGTGLPSALEDLVAHPPAPGDWVPVVWLCALHAGVYDTSFASDGGMLAYEEWVFQRNLRLLRAPLFRRLVEVQSPELLLALHTARWSAFYRGSSLDILQVEPGRAVFRMSHPPRCWPTLAVTGLGAAFRAAAVVAGAKTATVAVTEESPRASRLAVSWSV